MKCPIETWKILKETFQAVREAATDAKLCKVQIVQLENGERIVEYSSKFIGIAGKLKSSGHLVSKIKNITCTNKAPTE